MTICYRDVWKILEFICKVQTNMANVDRRIAPDTSDEARTRRGNIYWVTLMQLYRVSRMFIISIRYIIYVSISNIVKV
jgi:hypothetical protein